VRAPEYSTTVLSDQEFFKLGYVRLSQVGINENQVTRVRITKPEYSDLEFVGNDVFLRKTDLIVAVENDYFVAKRAKLNNDNCKCEVQEDKYEQGEPSPDAFTGRRISLFSLPTCTIHGT